jgi:hypothetical protein
MHFDCNLNELNSIFVALINTHHCYSVIEKCEKVNDGAENFSIFE